MGKPVTLLERICEHALSIGGEAIVEEYQDRREWVYARKGDTALSIASFPTHSAEAKELRQNLRAAARKPIRAVLQGKLSTIKVRIVDSFGEDAFQVTIDVAPRRDQSVAPKFTAKQGQYLTYICHYSKIHRQAPAESDLQRYFGVSPPAVHDMIKTLERNGLIERTPGVARSIRLLVRPEHLPPLE